MIGASETPPASRSPRIATLRGSADGAGGQLRETIAFLRQDS